MTPLITQGIALGIAVLFALFAVVLVILLIRSNKRDKQFGAALPGVQSPVDDTPSTLDTSDPSEENEFDFKSAPPTIRRIEVPLNGNSNRDPIRFHAPELDEFPPGGQSTSSSRPGRRIRTATEDGTSSSPALPAPTTRRRSQ